MMPARMRTKDVSQTKAARPSDDALPTCEHSTSLLALTISNLLSRKPKPALKMMPRPWR